MLYYGLFLFSFLYTALTIALSQPFPVSMDELPHYSYIVAEARSPELLPDYPEMKLLDPSSLARFTEQPNYLDHPSAYYLLLSPIARLCPGRVLPMRLANTAIATAAVLLLFAAGLRCFATSAEHAVFAGVLVFFPKLTMIAAIVNNDNLAFLGGALVIAAMMRRRQDSAAAAAMGAGLMIAGWSKLTAAILLGVLILAWVLPRLQQMHRRSILALALFGLAGALPYLANLVATGSLLWQPPAADFGIGAADVHAPLGALVFTRLFFSEMLTRWAAFGLSDGAEIAGLLVTLGVFALSLRRSRLSRAAAVALVATLAIHVGFEYLHQRHFGIWPGSEGSYPRYYLPLWPAIAAGCAVAVGGLPGPRTRAAAAVLLLGLLAWGFPSVAAARYLHAAR